MWEPGWIDGVWFLAWDDLTDVVTVAGCFLWEAICKAIPQVLSRDDLLTVLNVLTQHLVLTMIVLVGYVTFISYASLRNQLVAKLIEAFIPSQFWVHIVQGLIANHWVGLCVIHGAVFSLNRCEQNTYRALCNFCLNHAGLRILDTYDVVEIY